jgi:hypothetical protein
MGYRSEVYIAVPKKAEKEMDAVMNKHNLFEKDMHSDSPFKKYDHEQNYTQWENDKGEVKVSKKLVIYEGTWLKWYEEYKDVQSITSIVEKYEPSDACMVCVGEDGEVHSDMGEYQDVFNIYTSVELQ